MKDEDTRNPRPTDSQAPPTPSTGPVDGVSAPADCLLYTDLEGCHRLTAEQLRRLPDGTVSFMPDAGVQDASRWDKVYVERVAGARGGAVTDSNHDPEATRFFAARVNSPFYRHVHILGAALPATSPTLEVGCGLAGISLALAETAGTVPYGLDIAPSAVGAARSRFHAHGLDPDTLSVCDVNRLPFAAGAFPLVFGKTVFEHFEDPRVAAAEIYRVTAPGGHAVFDVPNARNAYWTRASERANRHEHKTDFFTLEQLRASFTGAGFELAQAWGDGLLYTTPYILLQEARRLLGRETPPSSAPASPANLGHAQLVDSERPAGRSPAPLRLLDQLVKRSLLKANRLANRCGIVTPRNGVLVGAVLHKPEAA